MEFYSNKLVDCDAIKQEVRQYYQSGEIPADGGLVSCGFVQYKTMDELKGQKPHEIPQGTADEPAALYPVTFMNLSRPNSCVRDGTTKSFRNDYEAQYIVHTLAELINAHKITNDTTIGVISFYQGQVLNLKRLLQPPFSSSSSSSSSSSHHGSKADGGVGRCLYDLIPRDFELNIEVNTVDGFQGKEKDIIILSCVRCSSEAVSSRSSSNNHRTNKINVIGFVADARRLNVAITRAKRCLLIVGCADTLSCDETWAHLISSLRERGYLITPAISQSV
jgi:superfamily I DNA and/or RNA helicase